jgi:AraC-like DNA-binding protein
MTPHRSQRQQPATDHQVAVYRAIEQMRACLSDPLHLADLARLVSFSPFHFHRLFRDLTTMTPARFLAAMRMAEARRLLLHSRLTVTAVSALVGYTSPGTFTTQFTRLVGASPARFRRLARRLAGLLAGSLAGAPAIASAGPAPAGVRRSLMVTVPEAGPEHLTVVVLRPLAVAIDPGQWPVAVGGRSLPFSLRPGNYEARVQVVSPGATLTEALIDDRSGTYLTGAARVLLPGAEGPTQHVEIHARPPRPTDPPGLSAAPLYLLTDAASARRHRTAAAAPRRPVPARVGIA